MDKVRTNVARLMAGRSVNSVGDESGVGQAWLQRWLNPDAPSGIKKSNPEKLALLAEYFGVSAQDLMWSDMDPAADAPLSQTARQQREIVRAGVRAVAIMKEGGLLMVTDENYAELLYQAMARAQSLGVGADANEIEIVRLARVVAEDLR